MAEQPLTTRPEFVGLLPRGQERVHHHIDREGHARGGIEDDHQRAGFPESGEVIGRHPLPRDDDGGWVERPGPRECCVQVFVRAKWILRGLPVVVRAVDDGRQREWFEVAEEVRAPPPPLKGSRKGEALVEGLPAPLRGAIATKQNRPASRIHAQRSCTTRGVCARPRATPAQRTEVRGQRSEVRKQRSENRRHSVFWSDFFLLSSELCSLSSAVWRRTRSDASRDSRVGAKDWPLGTESPMRGERGRRASTPLLRWAVPRPVSDSPLGSGPMANQVQLAGSGPSTERADRNPDFAPRTIALFPACAKCRKMQNGADVPRGTVAPESPARWVGAHVPRGTFPDLQTRLESWWGRHSCLP